LERAATRYTRHVLAMMLILSMQSDAQTFPNIDFLKKRFGDGNRAVPTGMDPDVNKDHLADMLGLLEFDLYGVLMDWAGKGVCGGLNLDGLATALGSLGAVIMAIGLERPVTPYSVPWDGAYPHPCSLVTREALVTLLA
jgi:hypothetical protein